MFQNTNSKFNPVLGTKDVLVVAFGAMIGWGWVVSTGHWIQCGGVIGTVLAFLIGGFMIYFIGLTYAELTTAIPKTGGEQNFSYLAFGSFGSFVCTWSLILSYIGVVCFEVVSFPTILEYIFPQLHHGILYSIAGFEVCWPWLLIAIVMAILMTCINILGVKTAAKLQTILTIIIAGVGIVLLAGSVVTGHVENIQTQAFVGDDSGFSVFWNIMKVAIMTPFFLFGFDVIPQAAEEIKMPLRKLGKLMLLSIVLAVVFYAMVVVAIGMIMNADALNYSIDTTGLVTADAMAIAFNSDLMAKVLIIGGLCGIVTSWNSFLIGGSRVMFSMAQSHMLPARFGRLHPKFKTPIMALILMGILSVMAPFFGRKMLIWIVDAANFACCLAYCMVAISFVIIRRKNPDLHRPYKVSHYKIVGFIAIFMSGIMVLMYLIPGTSCSLLWQEWVIVGGWILLGAYMGLKCKSIHKENFASNMDF